MKGRPVRHRTFPNWQGTIVRAESRSGRNGEGVDEGYIVDWCRSREDGTPSDLRVTAWTWEGDLDGIGNQ